MMMNVFVFLFVTVAFPAHFLCIRCNNCAKSCIHVKKSSGVLLYNLKYLENRRKRLGMNVIWQIINTNYDL